MRVIAPPAYGGFLFSYTRFMLSKAKTWLLAQEFKRIGCRLGWLRMEGFPERWIIILRAVYPRKNFLSGISVHRHRPEPISLGAAARLPRNAAELSANSEAANMSEFLEAVAEL